MLGHGRGAPCYSSPENWLGKDSVAEKLRAGRGAKCKERWAGRVVLWR